MYTACGCGLQVRVAVVFGQGSNFAASRKLPQAA